jgi:Ca2+-binding EF-hand superfamily protein
LSNIGIQLTKKEADEMLLNLDLNNNGSIDYTEFLAGCLRSKIYLKEDHLRSAFEYFDKVIFKSYLIILFSLG